MSKKSSAVLLKRSFSLTWMAGGYGGNRGYRNDRDNDGYGGGGGGGYNRRGGGGQESHANFGMRRDRRDSDRRQQYNQEEFKEPSAGEPISSRMFLMA